MAKQYEIYSLRVGELYIPHGHGTLRDPVHCWLVDDGVSPVLVDSGMPTAADSRRMLGIDGIGGGSQGLIAALATIGRKPADIQNIILTHLHFDHAWNLELFPHACITLQRDELLHAVDPVPTQRIFYRRETIIELIGRKRPSQLRLIDGDYSFAQGLELLKIPAHTPGMHVPIVSTQRGRVALVSDLGDHYRNWFPGDARATKKPMRYLAGDFLPSPIRTAGEREYQAAMRRVFEASDIVVPAHDFRIPRHMPLQWYAIPESTDGDLADVPQGRLLA